MPGAAPGAANVPQAIAKAVLLSNVGKRAKSNVWKAIVEAAKLSIQSNVRGSGVFFEVEPPKMDSPLSKTTPESFRVSRFLTADRLALAGLLVFTVLVRGSVLWSMRGNLQQDADSYREIAENLLQHGEF